MTISISVVIPCYNMAGIFEPTLRSVQAQTRPADEIIIVDDGSSDDTADDAQRILPAARVIRQPHRGLAATRNTGWKAATSTHVAFLDGDDLWTPDHLKNADRFFQSHPDIRWYTCAWRVRDEMRNIHLDMCSTGPFEDTGDVLNYFTARPQGNFPLVGSGAAVVAREFLETTGGFDEQWRRGEDIEFWSRLGGYAPRVGYSRNVGMIYVKRSNSLSESPLEPAAVSLRLYHKIRLNAFRCKSITPAQRIRWFSPWARLSIRALLMQKDTTGAANFTSEMADMLSLQQKITLSLFQLWPEALSAWYCRKSVLRQLLRI